MNFLIIGDSWGLGEYSIQNNIMSLVANSGIDYYLATHGHTSKNLSVGSASNFGQLRHCRTLLESDIKQGEIDYIIWFHTEPIRDISDTIIDDIIDGPIQFPKFSQLESFDQAMAYINYQNYVFAQTIYDTYKIPFITVGGLGKIHNSIKEFTFSKHIIISWAQEILGSSELPDNVLSRDREKELISRLKFNHESIISVINQSQYYRELLSNSSEFPDGLHPCTDQYRKLTQRILSLIK